MNLGSTYKNIKTNTIDLNLGLLNAENLFLMFDHPIPENFLSLNEVEWQKLSNSVYENKSLLKCIQIAEIIKEQKPDIMMFCEVGGHESLKNFNQLFLNNEYLVALIEGNSDRHIDVGFLIHKKLNYYFNLKTNKQRDLKFQYAHELISEKTGYSFQNQIHFFSRDCSELHLFTHNNNEPFLIILLTHLKSRLDPEKIDPGGTERRTAEMNSVIEIFNELKIKYPSTPILLAGDLNGHAGLSNTDTEFLTIYKNTDLLDVLEIAQVPLIKRCTYYQVKSGGRTDGKQIDYCFLPKNLHSHLNFKNTFVYRYKNHLGVSLDKPRNMDEKLKLPSDHYPLFFTLENISI